MINFQSLWQLKLDDSDIYAEEAIVEIGALRNAYTAYKSEHVQSDPWTTKEPMIPGVPAQSRDEYFFLSYAQVFSPFLVFFANNYCAFQSKCAARTDDNIGEIMSRWHWLPEELAINNALKQLKEFSDVFRCPAGSPMNPTDRCKTIF